MNDDAKDTIDYLRARALSSISQGMMWDVEMCTKGIAAIERLAAEVERLTAEVERLTPREMTLQEACDVLNEKGHLFTSTWMVRAGGVGSDGKPLVISEQDIITGSEAIWIAQGLLRDAGPSDAREPRGEGDAC